MGYVEIEGKQYKVTGYAPDGLPIIQATVTQTQDGFDEEGNPKISAIINVPAIGLEAIGGENGE